MSDVDLLLALQRLGDGEASMDFAAHRELFDPEFDFRFGALDPVIGIDPYIENFREFRAAFSDYTVEVPIPPIVAALHAVTTWVMHARMTGSFVGLGRDYRHFGTPARCRTERPYPLRTRTRRGRCRPD